MTLSGLGSRPLWIAPMAGGPTTIDLVTSAAQAGAFGFLAGAYRTADEVASDIEVLKAGATGPFGVNIFVPRPSRASPTALEGYLDELAAEAAHLHVEVGRPRWDDDDWDAKVDLLIESAPAVASFTFGCPPPAVIKALQGRQTLVMVTVTSAEAADDATAAGVDVLCAQGIEAGAHRGSFDDTAPDGDLTTVDLVKAITSKHHTPVVAAGGISTPSAARQAIAAGATAVQAGTAFLLSDEAGTNPTHRSALANPSFSATTMTRAFTGRRARGLVNGFIRRHPAAPSAFPEIHHATAPIRAAAAQQHDPDRLHLWAGTGHRHARSGPAAGIIDWLLTDASP